MLTVKAYLQSESYPLWPYKIFVYCIFSSDSNLLSINGVELLLRAGVSTTKDATRFFSFKSSVGNEGPPTSFRLLPSTFLVFDVLAVDTGLEAVALAFVFCRPRFRRGEVVFTSTAA